MNASILIEMSVQMNASILIDMSVQMNVSILIDLSVQMNSSRVEWMVELIYMNGFHFQVIFPSYNSCLNNCILYTIQNKFFSHICI